MLSALLKEWSSGKPVGGVEHRRLRAIVAQAGVAPGLFDDPRSWRSQQGVEHLVTNNTLQWVRYSLDVRATLGTRVFLAYLGANQLQNHLEMVAAVNYADRSGWLDRPSIPATEGEP